MIEAAVTVNGIELTNAQVMTMRVALNNFLIDMQVPDALGDDEHGKAMTIAYKARIIEILKIM